MDILLTDDIIIDYRTDDFGIDNEGLEFGFESLLSPPVVVVAAAPSSGCTPTSATLSNVKGEDGVGGVEQSLPDSPPDSSGSPPSSVYSPVDIRQARKRRRNSDGTGMEGTVLCELMLGQALKDENKDMHGRYAVTGSAGMITMATQCPYSAAPDDIKPLMVPVTNSSGAININHETYQQPGGQQQHNNYHQLTTAPGYYNNYLDFEAANSYGGGSSNGQQQEDLYSQQQQHHNNPQQQHHQQQQHQQQHTFVEMPSEGHLNSSGGESQGLLMASPDSMQRKRKMTMENSFDDASPGASATPDSQYNSDRGMAMVASNNSVDGSTGEGSLPGTPMQCIRFEPFQAQQWHPLCDHQLQDLPTPHYRVDADKGFNFSASDDAFVCQKKNHFQVTCHTQLIGYGAAAGNGTAVTGAGTGQAVAGGAVAAGSPVAAFNVIFVRTQNGLEKVRNFCLHFYGVKFEAPRHMIRVEQSQSDRSKKQFHPVVIDLHCGQVSKTTVGRLHFSETTSNNMRKKGRPNPEQRYFRLVVALHAHTHTGDYPIVVHGSEKIIVRASNPGQFENDFELCWQRGVTPDSIFHNGKIGLNTDHPDECLVVNGNLKVTGHILQPSDCRIKRELTELNSKEQLENIQQIRIVRYAYQDGVPGREAATGVMAQEVRRVLPDAVFEQQSAYNLPNGGKLDKFLVVNKDRIFLENVGAVKELSKLTGKLEQRIQQLEINQSEMASQQRDLSISPKSLKAAGRSNSWDTVKLGNHSIQWIIVVLIVVMTVCLSTLATLFFMEHYDESVRHRYYDSMAYRRENQELAGVAGSKQQSIAYSHNYTALNDHVLIHASGKPAKKSTSYKTGETGGGGGDSSAGGSNHMSFPSFTENRSGTSGGGGGGNILATDPNLQQLNWNNIEFSFLYIYKLQQYYNELQKKVKGKLPLFGDVSSGGHGTVPSANGAGAGGGVSTSEVIGENPTNAEDDCDSPETAGETAEETNGGAGSDNIGGNGGGGGGGGDLKLMDEEFMNRLLANILSIRNQSSTESSIAANNPVLHKPIKKNTSDKSAIDSEAAIIPESTQRTTLNAVGKKEQLKESRAQQEPDIENLINSNK